MRSLVACLVIAIPFGSAFSTFSSPASLGMPLATTTPGALHAFKFGQSPAAIETEPASDDAGLQDTIVDPLSDVLVATLRVGTCALMIHHGLDKIQNVDGFSTNVVAKFFGFLPGDPSFWTLSAAATQVAGSVLLALGVLARPVALSMCATMVTAVVFHLLNTGPEGFPLAVVPQHSYNYELAAMYVGVLAYFSVAGAGKYSVDELVLGGELNLYQRLANKLVGTELDNVDDDLTNAYVKNKKEFKAPWSK